MPTPITNYNDFLTISNMSLGNGVNRARLTSNYNAWHTDGYTTNATSYLEALNNKDYFVFNARIQNDYTKIATLTSCQGLLFNGSSTGPKRIAFGYYNAGNPQFNLIADFEIQKLTNQNTGIDHSYLINQALSANPIIIDGNYLYTEIIIAPYQATGSTGKFRIYETNRNPNYFNGADIIFNGYIDTGNEVIPSSNIPGPAGTPTTTTPAPDTLAPSSVYVLYAGTSSVNGIYTYSYISAYNSYEYYNETTQSYIIQDIVNKWYITNPNGDCYVSVVSADYPNDIEYNVADQGVSPAPIVSIDSNAQPTTTTTAQPTTTTTTTPEPSICVSGAGSINVNGTYNFESAQGRGVWTLSSESGVLSAHWSDTTNTWRIDGIEPYYYSYDNVISPLQVTTWNTFSGALPVPFIISGPC